MRFLRWRPRKRGKSENKSYQKGRVPLKISSQLKNNLLNPLRKPQWLPTLKGKRRRIGRRGERRREPPCSSLHPQATGSTASAYKTKASTGIRRGSTSTSTTTGTTPHNAKLSTATDCFVTLTRTGATGHTTALPSHIGTTNAETDKN